MNVMQINPSSLIQEMNELSSEAKNKVSTSSASKVGETFKGYLENAVGAVNNEQDSAHKLKVAYTQDDPNVSLSKVMIQMQKAEVSLTALTTVRNKLLEGYKSLMSMTV